MKKIIFMFLLLGTQLNANTIIVLSNYGEVRLLDNLKKTAVILDTFSFTKNDDVRLRFSEFLNPECTLVKYYIHQKRYSFFGSINQVNLFVYDIGKRQFLLHQVEFFIQILIRWIIAFLPIKTL
jgi:hypothetical protein